jgi:hypothetical protein
MPFAARMSDAPAITLMLVGVFVLVVLANGWILGIRDWIRLKVAE